MALLDTVIKMQQQGIEDKDIAKSLREKGFAPKDIMDAISQSKIKAAVSQDNMQESVMQPQQFAEQAYPQEQQYQQNYYPQAPQYQAVQADTEMIREVAEEVAEEKVIELRDSISKFSLVEKEITSKIEQLDRRLKQIEGSIDKLQIAILGKISGYSKDLENVTTELKSTQEAFKKVINPVVDKIREKAKKK